MAADGDRSNALTRIFSLDLRSLAACRIGIGLLLLANLYQASWDVEAYFADSGVLSREARISLGVEGQWTAPSYCLSLNMLSGETWFQATLLALAVVPAVGVLVGYRTRTSLAVSWLLVVGFQARNPLILNGGDDVLRCLLLWSVFVPMGRVWSFDRWSCDRRTNVRDPNRTSYTVTSLATFALIFQLCCIYWFTGVLKIGPMWRSDFSATYYALSMHHFTTPAGYWLLQFPDVLQAVTAVALLVELCAPTLLFAPLGTSKFRGVIAATFIAFHAGLGVTLQLGMFPVVCIVYWVALLPGELWEARIWRALVPRRTIIQRKRPVHDRVPGNGWAVNSLVVVLLIYVTAVNIVRCRGSIHAHLNPGPLRLVGDAFQLNQHWCMFAPFPHRRGGWFALTGTTAQGNRVNLMHPEQPPADIQPDLISATYPAQRWRKLLLNLLERRNEPAHPNGLCDYLRRRWDRGHAEPDHLTAVEFVYFSRENGPPDAVATEPAPLERTVVHRWE